MKPITHNFHYFRKFKNNDFVFKNKVNFINQLILQYNNDLSSSKTLKRSERNLNNLKNRIKYAILDLNNIKLKNHRLKKQNKLNNKPIIKKKKKRILKVSKGYLCLKNGLAYEKKIYFILKDTWLDGKRFNTQKINEIAGSKSHNDLNCNFLKTKNLGIEIKIANTPDWMQCSIKKTQNGNWCGVTNSKIPEKSKLIFNKLLKKVKIFNNMTPPFFKQKITHSDWKLIKKETDNWNDQYLKIPNDIIKNIYREKECYYIQISDYGLYHLGNDICNFNVPEFLIEQQLRIRTKIHTKENQQGYCNLSVIASCQPINIRKLKKSNYSLDDIKLLPINLIYH